YCTGARAGRSCDRSGAEGYPAITYPATTLIAGYTQRRFLGGTRAVEIPLLRCPQSGFRRRTLYVVGRPQTGAGLGCRACHRLLYQSQTRRCNWELTEAVSKRFRALAQEPGPKGSRYRLWMKRARRIAARIFERDRLEDARLDLAGHKIPSLSGLIPRIISRSRVCFSFQAKISRRKPEGLHGQCLPLTDE